MAATPRDAPTNPLPPSRSRSHLRSNTQIGLVCHKAFLVEPTSSGSRWGHCPLRRGGLTRGAITRPAIRRFLLMHGSCQDGVFTSCCNFSLRSLFQSRASAYASRVASTGPMSSGRFGVRRYAGTGRPLSYMTGCRVGLERSCPGKRVRTSRAGCTGADAGDEQHKLLIKWRARQDSNL